MKRVTAFFIYLGIIRRRREGGLRWPLHFGPEWMWRYSLRHPIRAWRLGDGFYIFRNLPGVIKWEEGRLLPRRWGFGVMGLIEVGDRG